MTNEKYSSDSNKRKEKTDGKEDMYLSRRDRRQIQNDRFHRDRQIDTYRYMAK